MKNFVINLLTNRFGIILAALNLCYFASRGEALLHTTPGKLFAAANLPAIVSTVVSLEFIQIFAHDLSHSAESFFGNLFFSFFIIAHWLLVAEIACVLAEAIRRYRSPQS